MDESAAFGLKQVQSVPDWQSVFALLVSGAESIRGAIASLDEIERDLSQWYGDRRLAM